MCEKLHCFSTREKIFIAKPSLVASRLLSILEMTVSDRLLSSKFQKSWCRIQKQLTLKREDYWMKTLRTIYPYSLNERVIKHDSEVPVGELLFSIPRRKQ